jgi:hypothetical protein
LIVTIREWEGNRDIQWVGTRDAVKYFTMHSILLFSASNKELSHARKPVLNNPIYGILFNFANLMN